jgi:hypothetical protein
LHLIAFIEAGGFYPLAGNTDATKNDLPVSPAKKDWTTYVGQAAGHPAAFFKRMKVVAASDGRTGFQCLQCDKVGPLKTDAVKWAASPLAAPTRAT